MVFGTKLTGLEEAANYRLRKSMIDGTINDVNMSSEKGCISLNDN